MRYLNCTWIKFKIQEIMFSSDTLSDTCKKDCENGVCTNDFICSCDTGYKGPNCNEVGEHYI